MTQAYTIWTYSISYLLFFSLLWVSKARKGIRLLDDNGIVANRVMLIVLHVAGVLLLGFISLGSFDHLGQVVFGKIAASSLQVIVTVFFVILAMFVASILAGKNYRRLSSRSVSSTLSNRFITNYFVVRVLFLATYETWFRGYLLTDCMMSWGFAAAVLINITLYTLLHAVNGKNEMVGCIPFGLLLCILCAWTEAAWPAILIHIAFTVSYEIHLVKKINKPSISFL